MEGYRRVWEHRKKRTQRDVDRLLAYACYKPKLSFDLFQLDEVFKALRMLNPQYEPPSARRIRKLVGARHPPEQPLEHAERV